MDVLPTVWQYASAQKRLVTLAQLRALGYTKSAIQHRLRTGRLWLVYPGVYAVGHPDLPRDARWLAAVLACGEGAALSHLSAAHLWAITETAPPPIPHVSVPTSNGRSGPPRIHLHRTPGLRPTDVTTRDDIPVTTLSRTHADIAGVLDAKQLKSAARQSERVHRLDLADLRTYAEGHSPYSFRHARLRAVVDAHVPAATLTGSEREAALLDLCLASGIPLPEPQVWIGRYRVDFLWRELRLVVEIDDRRSHDGDIAFGDDRIRDRTLLAAGFVVMRFTVVELLSRPAVVAADLLAAIDRRRAGLAR